MSKVKTKWVEDEAITPIKIGPFATGTSEKTALADDDRILIEDSASTFDKAYTKISAFLTKILTTSTPTNVNRSAASAGSATKAALSDHKHDIDTAAPTVSIGANNVAADGSGADLMRADATIALDTSGTRDDLSVGQSGADGTANGVARKDHSHGVPAASATEITDSTNSAGSSGNFVHSDHKHAHGDRGGGSLHALAIASGAAGFISGSDKQKLDDVESGATATVPRHDTITSEDINGTDTALSDTLDHTPVDVTAVLLNVNGHGQRYGVDFSISGTTITWLGTTSDFDLESDDNIDVYYDSAS